MSEAGKDIETIADLLKQHEQLIQHRRGYQGQMIPCCGAHVNLDEAKQALHSLRTANADLERRLAEMQEKYDTLHDQRHAEARKADLLATQLAAAGEREKRAVKIESEAEIVKLRKRGTWEVGMSKTGKKVLDSEIDLVSFGKFLLAALAGIPVKSEGENKGIAEEDKP
jgi:hypothetical protein